jgi:hypothetical protein
LLLPHASSILELIQRCLSDDERTDAEVKLSYGLLGDLADCFPNGELKQILLQEWIAYELRSKARLPGETKKTMRWAREVCTLLYMHRFLWCLFLLFLDDQASHCIGNIIALPSLFFLSTTCHISLFPSLSSSRSTIISISLNFSYVHPLKEVHFNRHRRRDPATAHTRCLLVFTRPEPSSLYLYLSLALLHPRVVGSLSLYRLRFTVNAIVRLLRLCSNVWTRYISVSHQQ